MVADKEVTEQVAAVSEDTDLPRTTSGLSRRGIPELSAAVREFSSSCLATLLKVGNETSRLLPDADVCSELSAERPKMAMMVGVLIASNEDQPCTSKEIRIQGRDHGSSVGESRAWVGQRVRPRECDRVRSMPHVLNVLSSHETISPLDGLDSDKVVVPRLISKHRRLKGLTLGESKSILVSGICVGICHL